MLCCAPASPPEPSSLRHLPKTTLTTMMSVSGTRGKVSTSTSVDHKASLPLLSRQERRPALARRN